MLKGRVQRFAEALPVSWTRATLCVVVGAVIGLTLTFPLNVENPFLFAVVAWGGLVPLGLLGISNPDGAALGVAIGLAHGAAFLVTAFTVAAVRFGRDASPRFDITVLDVLIAALLYAAVFSVPGDVPL